jgi:hypothetical protein
VEYEAGKYYYYDFDESTYKKDENSVITPGRQYYLIDDNYYSEGPNKGWNKKVFEAPDELTFWFDLLDTPHSEISKYSTEAVGVRA